MSDPTLKPTPEPMTGSTPARRHESADRNEDEDGDQDEDEDAEQDDDGRAVCSLCNARVEVDQVQYLNDQPACASCVNQVREELAAQQPTGRDYPLALLGGFVGATLGAAVWAAVAIITDMEVGYVAVLVGFLAGFGVRVAAGKKRSLGMQIMAAALSVVGLVLAKYMILAHVLVSMSSDGGMDISYFDSRILEIFPMAMKEMVSPFDALWLILAIAAAYRVPQPSQIALH